MKRFGLTSSLLLFSAVTALAVETIEAPRWHEIKGTHFILALQRADGVSPERVLERAESHYDRIARLLGFSGLSSIWLWDKRCRIYLYATQDEFMKHTGRPAWSSGFAKIDSRQIVSYEGAPDFSDGVLPHEMTHLILRDFVGPSNKGIPLWLEEGVAMAQEKNPRTAAEKERIPMRDFCAIRSLSGLPRDRIAAFYAQSLSVARFLLERYDAKLFAALCRDLRDGTRMDEALQKMDPVNFSTLEDFEKQWIAAASR